MSKFFIAEIAYDNERKDWWITRHGVVAEQGGMNLGEETVIFPDLKSALSYIEFSVNRDMEDVLEAIKRKLDSNK